MLSEPVGLTPARTWCKRPVSRLAQGDESVRGRSSLSAFLLGVAIVGAAAVAIHMDAAGFDPDEDFDLTRCLTVEENHDFASDESRLYHECLVIELEAIVCARKLTKAIPVALGAGMKPSEVSESVSAILRTLLIGEYDMKRSVLKSCGEIGS